jgi:hypothetical protein
MYLVMIGGAVLAAKLYVGAVGLMAWQQRRFIYRPDRSRPVAPAGAAEVALRTGDGLELLAWSAAASEGAPVVLYLHGNGGNLGNRAGRFAAMRDLGWGVLMPEYRGYGGNPGVATEAAFAADMLVAYDSLRAQGVAPGRIVVWGESLGSGLAARLAVERPVGAVVLETPYTSIADVAQWRFPFLPARALIRDRFELAGRIGDVTAPVLVMVAGRDRIVPPRMGHAVFAVAREPKALWVAAEAGHVDLMAAGALDAVRGFLSERLR